MSKSCDIRNDFIGNRVLRDILNITNVKKLISNKILI